MHAKLTNKPAKLWISKEYSSFSDDICDKILSLKIFKEVKIFESAPVFQVFFHHLMKNEPEIAFDEILDDYFANIFHDIKEETFFIFNEYQLYYYYIEKYCKNITLVEDGYKSYQQQNKILRFKGQYTYITQYIGKYFPDVQGASKKITKYLVNEIPTDILKHQKDFIERCNFIEMEKELLDEMESICRTIFEYPRLDENEKSSLVLTQPLARANYCRYSAQFKLYDSLINKELARANKVYVKPHPADLLSYKAISNQNVIILNKNFPIEVYNYEKTKFQNCLTFGSTALGIAKYADKTTSMYSKRNTTHNKISKFIYHKTKKSRISLLIIVEILEDEEITENKLATLKKLYSNKLFELKIIAYGKNVSRLNAYKGIKFLNLTDKQEVAAYCLNNYQFNYAMFTNSSLYLSNNNLRSIHFSQRTNFSDIIVCNANYVFKYENKNIYITAFNIIHLLNENFLLLSRNILSTMCEENDFNLLKHHHKYNYSISYIENNALHEVLEYFKVTKKEELISLVAKLIDNLDNISEEISSDYFQMIISLVKIIHNYFPKEVAKLSKKIPWNEYFNLTANTHLVKYENIQKNMQIANSYFFIYYKLHIEKIVIYLRNNGLYKIIRKFSGN